MKGRERSTRCRKKAVQQGWCQLSPYSSTALSISSDYSSLQEKVILMIRKRADILEIRLSFVWVFFKHSLWKK